MAGIVRIITVVVFALGLLSGCSNESYKWHGRWEGDLDRADPSMPDDATKRTINLLRIDIKSDGTFEMMESGITSSGVTKLGSEQAFLTVRERLGQSLSRSGSGTQSRDQDLVLEWGEDGRVFYRDPGAYGGTKVEVKKVSGD